MRFTPEYAISPRMAVSLMRIEAARQAMTHLPVTPRLLATLRATARLSSTHYSTMIEGNRLTQEQVSRVIGHKEHFAGRERDEKEVLGYFAAMEKVEQLAARGGPVTETQVRTLHGLAMGGGGRARPSPYRDGQNVIRDSRSGAIVYLPPEATDVAGLMRAMIGWLASEEARALPCPIVAGIAHYQFATIHPYYDGNGRTARLLTTLILHLGGYDLKGLYSLEEYYARDLAAYYRALTVGPSHNYYVGRAEADITGWVEYFCEGVAQSFENVRKRAAEAGGGEPDRARALRSLDPRQRRALELFREQDEITSSQVGALFGISQRAARNLLTIWTERRFVTVTDAARKSRRYRLGRRFVELVGR